MPNGNEIARCGPAIDAAVLHAGAARVPGKFRDRPLSMDGVRVAAAAAVTGAAAVIPAHLGSVARLPWRLNNARLSTSVDDPADSAPRGASRR